MKEGRCTVCGRSQAVDMAYCLGHGWPKCCGYTMRVECTPAEMGEAADKLFGGVATLVARIKKQVNP